jgi:hypothetical protein
MAGQAPVFFLPPGNWQAIPVLLHARDRYYQITFFPNYCSDNKLFRNLQVLGFMLLSK